MSLGIAFVAGLLSFASPCVLPLVPSYLSFITGMSLEDLKGGARRGRVLTHSMLFIAGFTLIFVLLGASATFVGGFLLWADEWIAKVGGALLLLFGLHLLGVFNFASLAGERRWRFSSRPSGYAGSALVGVAFAAGWTPCVGPVLGAILTLAAQKEHVLQGAGLLWAYSLGLAVPLFLSALLTERLLRVFAQFRSVLPWLQRISGVVLAALGLLLLTGSFATLASYLNQFAPEFLLERI